MRGEVYNLICEGDCNDGLTAVIDDVIRAAMREAHDQGSGHVGDEQLWRQQRMLKYTIHRQTRQDYAECLTCKKERRFGNTVFTL